MAKSGDRNQREMESYVDTGSTKSLEVTLSGTPGTVSTVYIPTDAKGFKIISASKVRFAVNATVAVVGTSSTASTASSVFTNGGVAEAGLAEVRLLPSNKKTKSTDLERYITLISLVASVVVTIEVF